MAASVYLLSRTAPRLVKRYPSISSCSPKQHLAAALPAAAVPKVARSVHCSSRRIGDTASTGNSGRHFWALGQRQGISSTRKACHGDHEEGFEHAQTVEILWRGKNGVTKTEAKCGMNLMRVAHKHGIDLEGACEGVCACSTCHVILSGEVFDDLPEASEDEEDMLDLAFGLTETSRLGCQVIVTPEMDGIEVKLPPATRNFYVDGHVPQPH